MACDPDILVADELTSALDVSIQAQILELLLDLRATRGLALVLVTHDLAVLKHLTDTTLIMHGGVVVETGSTAQILEDPSTITLALWSTPAFEDEVTLVGGAGKPVKERFERGRIKYACVGAPIPPCAAAERAIA